FTKEMLEWKSERVEIWDTKMNAMQSTGFDKTISNDEEIEYPQYVYDIIAENQPHYQYLFQHRIKI
ncbi:9877_t:CDS:2, partial [Racocetra fulgida]